MIGAASSGWPSILEDRLEQLFASSPTLQAAVDKTPERVRDDHIFNDYAWYIDTDDGLLKAMRPLVVFQEAELSIVRDTQNADGSQGNLWYAATEVLITDNAMHPGNIESKAHRESKKVFVGFVGQILADIERVAQKDINAGFMRAEMGLRYSRTPPKDRSVANDIWEFSMLFQFGVEG